MAASKDDITTKDFALTTVLALIEDYHSFNPDTTVPTYAYPTHLEFSKQVARGRPCVYRLDRTVVQDSHATNKGGARGETNDKGKDEFLQNDEEKQKPSFLQDVECRRLREEQRSILSAPCWSWTKKSLCDLVQEEVEVAVTPDGRADALYSLPLRRLRPRAQGHALDNEGGKQRDDHVGGHGDERGQAGVDQQDESECECEDEGVGEGEAEAEQIFLQPATTSMTLSTLIDRLCPSNVSPSPSPSPVYYLQSQNSNLHTSPLSRLLPSLPPTPPPFSAAVLGAPEAVNLWIGNASSVTSTHRDPYENLYLVVKGRKRFVLFSPVEEVCLHAQRVRTGRWRWVFVDDDDGEKGKFEVVMDDDDDDDDDDGNDDNDNDNRIPWIPIDPLRPPPATSQKFPYYRHARPLSVTVSEGEILYLPAGWFHHVSQECGFWKGHEQGDNDDATAMVAPCIAVNYWFDMDYSGEKHVMREMVGRLVERTRIATENG
ncbi:uncharacterized protein Z519_11034 [Cladophialophora bantiana CBS 173.52]|uniref:JmjC domain-containing protein n=1 Tax=Cladophialophora bantiana (strain ATCC 10958 / CBS 173.52 / CDC B-1940 / NIH 8579) TaxID=1442370 RepID=A0A0D2HC22_CLAB1|nr:uncharacterized protein Z519_11034 [Cladophialophora bantiana CBS 173.52]KIW88465.1 hypothetical protein Z519_11034 [Cladophialophora bantiana CBS 173.52]